MFLLKVSYVQQGCIYVIKEYSKNSNKAKYITILNIYIFYLNTF